MLNWINKTAKMIYLKVASNFSSNIQAIIFPNIFLYALVLGQKCATVKQLKEKNIMLVEKYNKLSDGDKFKAFKQFENFVRAKDAQIKNNIKAEHEDIIAETYDRYVRLGKTQLGVKLDGKNKTEIRQVKGEAIHMPTGGGKSIPNV